MTDPGTAAELLDVLAEDAEPDGTVLLDGTDLHTVTLDSARAALLVARHDASLFEGTLADNIGPELAPDELVAALVASGADEVRDTMPDGLDTEIGERGRTLSGGQRQRVALARALAADPDVLVLHDPTTAIDAATEDRIATGLRRHRAGRSTLMITSSPALLARCDRVIMIDERRQSPRRAGTRTWSRTPAIARRCCPDETAERPGPDHAAAGRHRRAAPGGPPPSCCAPGGGRPR